MYCPMVLENVLGYRFACLFIQYNVTKGEIFTTVLQKDKLKSAMLDK